MNQNLKHIQLTANTAKRFAVKAICPCMRHRMWVVAGYPVVGGGAV